MDREVLEGIQGTSAVREDRRTAEKEPRRPRRAATIAVALTLTAAPFVSKAFRLRVAARGASNKETGCPDHHARFVRH
jgi:hypothetical protein